MVRDTTSALFNLQLFFILSFLTIRPQSLQVLLYIKNLTIVLSQPILIDKAIYFDSIKSYIMD